MERRSVLRALGVGSVATMTSLAGCNSADDGDGDDGGDGSDGSDGSGSDGARASYDDWVGVDSVDDGSLTAFTLELSVLRALQDDESTTTEGEQTTGEESETDPLSGIPGTFVFAAAFGLGFGLSSVGLSALVEADGDADRAHFVQSAIVLEGSFDADSVSSSVEDSGAESLEDYEGFTLYEGGSEGQKAVVGVSGDAVVYVNQGEDIQDPTGRAKTVIDAGVGNADPYRDESSDYDSLVTALQSRGLMAVQFSTEEFLFANEETTTSGGQTSGFSSFSSIDLTGDANGAAVSADLSTDELVSELVIQYASEDEVDSKEDIEAALGGQADERTVDIDGRMAYVEGTYTTDS